jgi:hypothetical protein
MASKYPHNPTIGTFSFVPNAKTAIFSAEGIAHRRSGINRAYRTPFPSTRLIRDFKEDFEQS